MRALAKLGSRLLRASVPTLAGFLIGFSLSGVLPDDTLRAQVLHCGIAGLISALGLHLVARRRERVIAQRAEQEEAASHQRAVHALNSMRESMQAKIRELEARANRLALSDSRRGWTSAGRELPL
ncbi:MAG: hypothetical protein L0Y71_07120 [Gemmataceae bacterium]|nr:hypothetical protein [Gemmataceae bacterium]